MHKNLGDSMVPSIAKCEKIFVPESSTEDKQTEHPLPDLSDDVITMLATRFLLKVFFKFKLSFDVINSRTQSILITQEK